MKITKQFSILIACFAIIFSMSSCGDKIKKIEQNYNDCTVDVILCSDLENSALPDSVQKLYAAAGDQQLFPGKDNLKIQYVPSGTLRRVDLSTPVELTVKYEQTAIAKIQDQLKKPTEKDIEDRVDKYLQGVDVASLNSKEKVDSKEKINRIKAFIEQKQNDESPYYSVVLFYSKDIKNSSWNDNTVYHSMDTIRSIIFSSPKAKYLVVYNPPAMVIDTLRVLLDCPQTALSVGETFQFTATVLPENAGNKAVTWKSDAPAVAEIDSTGLVTAKSEGTVTITATTQEGGKTASCGITVTPKKVPVTPVTSVSLNSPKTSLSVGKTFQFAATVLPKEASNKTVTWKSDVPAVAEIDTTGLVTTKSEGSAMITATTQDGGKTASCKITVKGSGSSGSSGSGSSGSGSGSGSGGKIVRGTKECSCLIYEGHLENGYPEGDGKATYKCSGQIAKHDRDAKLNSKIHAVEAGDYFVGSWGNGDIISGTLYDRNGNIKEKIYASKRSAPYDICNDF